MKRFVHLLSFLMLAFYAEAQVGTWSGELDIQGTKLPLVFHFNDDNSTLDSPSQGARGIKMVVSRSPEGKVVVNIPSIMATYDGFVMPTMIVGSFTQSGMNFPLTLKQGEQKPKRPQTPKPPFPYSEEEVTFQNDGFSFHGTLTLPHGYDRNTPLLVMVTGSGLQNRDEELLDHKPFAVIADALAREGIATMRFDDRGWGDDSFQHLNFTIDDHKADAVAAVSAMRKRFKRVGTLGHSEGGTIALMMAAEGKVDFCVTMAAMAVSGRQTLLQQNRTMLSFLNPEDTVAAIPAETVNAYVEALDRAFDDLVANKQPEEVDDSKVPDMLKENFRLAVRQLATPYMRHFLKTDIRASLRKVKCPVLALNGTYDTQVNATDNLSAIEKGLTGCKHQVVACEGLNHLFQHCHNGLPSEYRDIEETVAPEVLKTISKWVKGL